MCFTSKCSHFCIPCGINNTARNLKAAAFYGQTVILFSKFTLIIFLLVAGIWSSFTCAHPALFHHQLPWDCCMCNAPVIIQPESVGEGSQPNIWVRFLQAYFESFVRSFLFPWELVSERRHKWILFLASVSSLAASTCRPYNLDPWRTERAHFTF